MSLEITALALEVGIDPLRSGEVEEGPALLFPPPLTFPKRECEICSTAFETLFIFLLITLPREPWGAAIPEVDASTEPPETDAAVVFTALELDVPDELARAQ